MPEDSNLYVPLFKTYFIFYFSISITSQFLLVYLIKNKSPATLDTLKKFLYNTCIIQIFLVCSASFQQHRVLPNPTTLAVLALGPCKYFGPNYCFAGYHTYIAISLAVGLAISITVLFRYLVLIMNNVTHNHINLILSTSYVIPLIVLILPFTATWDFDDVQKATSIDHPTYNLSIYEPYPGFCDVQSLSFLVATGFLAVGGYGIPLVCLVLTRKVLSLIQYHQHMSAKTKKQSQTLVYGLAVQTILPFISYIPTFSSYIYVQATGEALLWSQYLILPSASLPGLVDPFISFYFIVPYRQAILEKLHFSRRRNENLRITSTATVSNLQ